MKNHIQSSSCLFRTALFVCSESDTFLMNYITLSPSRIIRYVESSILFFDIFHHLSSPNKKSKIFKLIPYSLHPPSTTKHPTIHPNPLWIISSQSNNPHINTSWLVSITADIITPNNNAWYHLLCDFQLQAVMLLPAGEGCSSTDLLLTIPSHGIIWSLSRTIRASVRTGGQYWSWWIP